MGSEEIWNLEYRHGFVFIGIMGKEDQANEKRAIFIKHLLKKYQNNLEKEKHLTLPNALH